MKRNRRAVLRPLKKRKGHIWARDPDDWYVENEWCSKRLFDVEKFEGRVWDPACGLGRVAVAARAAGVDAIASDLRVRGFKGAKTIDFFRCQSSAMQPNIVSNPPFKFADAWVAHALNLSRRKLALLLPTAWVQSNNRSIWLERTPLRTVYLLSPRPSMPPGTALLAGLKPGQGMTDFCWAVWEHGHVGRASFVALRRDDGPIIEDAPHAIATAHPPAA